MVVKTELCSFSEWKIYPGKGVRFVAKDGRPFLFLSKRNRCFGLRYAPSLIKKAQGPKTQMGYCLEETPQENKTNRRQQTQT